jgi:small Trp-rich protein
LGREAQSLGYHQHNVATSPGLTLAPVSRRRFPTENRMLFVVIGLVLIALNLAGIGPFGAWNWEFFGDLWKFCVPFVLAIVWWIYSDKSGLNKRREMERMEDKKKARRAQNLEALGMDTRARRKAQRQQQR